MVTLPDLLASVRRTTTDDCSHPAHLSDLIVLSELLPTTIVPHTAPDAKHSPAEAPQGEHDIDNCHREHQLFDRESLAGQLHSPASMSLPEILRFSPNLLRFNSVMVT